MTGWNLPPGCSVSDLPGYEEHPCGVCGQWVDDCICPECPTCHSQGDPACYTKHGMVRNMDQQVSLATKEKEWQKQAEAEAAYAEEYAKARGEDAE